jgi:hypothetical protein
MPPRPHRASARKTEGESGAETPILPGQASGSSGRSENEDWSQQNGYHFRHDRHGPASPR